MRFTSLSLLSPFIGTSLLSNLIQPIHASPVAPLHPTLRQRDLSLDVCASLSLHLLFINLDACVCLSTATSFCQNNGLDKSLITNLVCAIIFRSPDFVNVFVQITTSSKKCSYPNHGRPTCSGKQCSFECIPPFIKSGQTCACPQGKTEYQGTCISSGSALPKVRRSNPVCMKGFTVCGAYGNGGPAWECVDTRSDLESCKLVRLQW